MIIQDGREKAEGRNDYNDEEKRNVHERQRVQKRSRVKVDDESRRKRMFDFKKGDLVRTNFLISPIVSLFER